MNVTQENLDNRTALLKVVVTPEDYNEPVEKALRQYRKKANMPGFRPGMVPMGIIHKMYRKGALAEESYKLASEGCFKHITDNKINAIGDLMPSDDQQPLDFDTQDTFEFVFEIGIAPEINIDLSKKDTVREYVIDITDEMRTGFKTNYMRRFGKLVDTNIVVKDEAVNATLENSEMKVEEAYVGLVSMTDEERAPFIGKKAGDTLAVNVNTLYKNPAQRASILGIKENELKGINPEFNLTITNIRTFEVPQLDEEFFKMAFPEGTIKNETDFNNYVDGQIAAELRKETDFKRNLDVKELLVTKANLELPESFLKKWLYNINEGKFSLEEIEKDFPQFLEMMKWDLIRKHYIAEFDLKVDEIEMLQEAKALTQMQFAQYGMHSMADEMLENYAKSILGNKEEAHKIQEKLFEQKITHAITEKITLKEKAISGEDFGKLFQAQA